ncbi:MAG: Wzz/FepE/Etk N-terminal domain-containing protein [Hungatella sp.]
MGTNQDDEIEINLKELFFEIKRKLWIIILAGIIGAAIVGVCTATLMKPVYTSSTMLYIVNKTTTLTSLADLQLGTQLTKDYKVLVTSRPVTAKVIENLDLNLDHEELLKHVSVDNPSDTRILTISVENHDPYMAKTIADEFADVASARMAQIMDSAPPNIVEEGYVPTKRTGPSIRKNTAVGGLCGILLAGAVILVLFVMNDSIKTPEDVEKYLGLTVLGTIPLFDPDEDKTPRRKPSKKSRRKLREEQKKKKEETTHAADTI